MKYLNQLIKPKSDLNFKGKDKDKVKDQNILLGVSILQRIRKQSELSVLKAQSAKALKILCKKPWHIIFLS